MRCSCVSSSFGSSSRKSRSLRDLRGVVRATALAAREFQVQALAAFAVRLGEQVDVDAVLAAFEVHIDQVDMARPRP